MKRKFRAISTRGQELSNRQKRKQAGILNRVPREQNLVPMLPHERWKHKKYVGSITISGPKLRHGQPGHIGN